MGLSVVQVGAADMADSVDALAGVLVDCVAAGAAVGFMAPLSREEAVRFWRDVVRPEVAAGRRALFAVARDGVLLGAVQLLTAMPVNQPHRAEIAKLIVHPDVRRQGLGRRLMEAALDHAAAVGKQLVTLDTRTGDAAEPLYASIGFKTCGVIPDYAWDPDGRARHATTYMYYRVPAPQVLDR